MHQNLFATNGRCPAYLSSPEIKRVVLAQKKIYVTSTAKLILAKRCLSVSSVYFSKLRTAFIWSRLNILLREVSPLYCINFASFIIFTQ